MTCRRKTKSPRLPEFTVYIHEQIYDLRSYKYEGIISKHDKTLVDEKSFILIPLTTGVHPSKSWPLFNVFGR